MESYATWTSIAWVDEIKMSYWDPTPNSIRNFLPFGWYPWSELRTEENSLWSRRERRRRKPDEGEPWVMWVSLQRSLQSDGSNSIWNLNWVSSFANWDNVIQRQLGVIDRLIPRRSWVVERWRVGWRERSESKPIRIIMVWEFFELRGRFNGWTQPDWRILPSSYCFDLGIWRIRYSKW